ncbi:hypothetical protein SCEN_M00600 [Saccharomyces cerevisiae]|nr:hypothetical protein SCEN_M00600 [Saccharomyces cerevisiae]
MADATYNYKKLKYSLLIEQKTTGLLFYPGYPWCFPTVDLTTSMTRITQYDHFIETKQWRLSIHHC